MSPRLTNLRLQKELPQVQTRCKPSCDSPSKMFFVAFGADSTPADPKHTHTQARQDNSSLHKYCHDMNFFRAARKSTEAHHRSTFQGKHQRVNCLASRVMSSSHWEQQQEGSDAAPDKACVQHTRTYTCVYVCVNTYRACKGVFV